MKKVMYLLYTIVFFSITNIYGQSEAPILPIDSLTGKILYSRVIHVDSLTDKNELFNRAKEWFARTYNSSKDVIQLEDKENGKIIGKGLIPINNNTLGAVGHIQYTIAIYIKDGRYKYEICEFYHKGQILRNGDRFADIGSCENMINTTDKNLFGGSMQKVYNNYLNQMNSKVIALINSLKKALAIKQTKTQNNDW